MTNQSIRTTTAITLLAALMLAALSTGCAWSIGENRDASVRRPTQGQELIDLKRARDQGVLSESEYEAQRQKIMRR